MIISAPLRDAIALIETPAVLIEEAVLARNIQRLSGIATQAGVALRPHVKMHKSLWLAGLQRQAGAAGVTAAKASEAVVFLEGGFRDVTVAYPLLDRRKIARLLAAARQAGASLRLVVDSPASVEAIAAEAALATYPVALFVEIDVGLGRCGIAPELRAVASLVDLIAQRPFLSFAGLFSHAGHAYRCDGPAAITEVAETERQLMTGLAKALRHAGIAVPAVSVGSTPTVMLARDFTGLTEIRPGNAVFMDMTQVALGVATRAEIALSVIATVVSANATHSIVDAGSKMLSSDQGPHGSKALSGYGLAEPQADPSREMPLVALSEEHGFIATGNRPLTPGERVRIWPNHACPVVNLVEALTVVSPDGALCSRPVDARGCVW